MRISTSSRSPETDTAEPVTTTEPVTDQTVTDRTVTSRTVTPPPAEPVTAPIKARSDEDEPTLRDLPPAPVADRTTAPPPPPAVRTESERAAALTDETPTPVEIAGPRPRASLIATLSLIFGVAGALLVLSGPLMGWGVGVAGVGVLLALFGIRATGKRHVAGKTDALLGLLFSLAAIVVGVLAMTHSLSWLTMNTPAVSNAREWLDTQFGNRF